MLVIQSMKNITKNMKSLKKTIQELQEYLQDYEGPTEQFSELVQKKCNRLAIWTH